MRMEPETLAHKLGTTAHISPLLMKARRLGLRGAEDFERLAIERGCRYYDLQGDSLRVREDARGYASGTQQERATLSNEELAMALFSICLTSSQHRLRLGAAMLGAEGNSPSRIASLAVQERCEVVVRHVAQCGRTVEPENAFWTDLLSRLPETVPPAVDTLPHITRFVAMTGFTRRGRETIMQWIRPTRPAA